MAASAELKENLADISTSSMIVNSQSLSILDRLLYAPTPIALTISSYLTITDLINLSQVCRLYKQNLTIHSSLESEIELSQWSYLLSTISTGPPDFQGLKHRRFQYIEHRTGGQTHSGRVHNHTTYVTCIFPLPWESYFSDIFGMGYLRHVSRINLDDSDIRSEVVNSFCQLCPNIKELSVRGCRNVDIRELYKALVVHTTGDGECDYIADDGFFYNYGVLSVGKHTGKCHWTKPLDLKQLVKLDVWGFGGIWMAANSYKLLPYEEDSPTVYGCQTLTEMRILMMLYQVDYGICDGIPPEGSRCRHKLASVSWLYNTGQIRCCTICKEIEPKENARCFACERPHWCEWCVEWTCRKCLIVEEWKESAGKFSIR